MSLLEDAGPILEDPELEKRLLQLADCGVGAESLAAAGAPPELVSEARRLQFVLEYLDRLEAKQR